MRTPEEETLEVQVTGCGPYSCCLLAMTIERVRKLPGVKRARVKVFPFTFLTKTLAVTYDPQRVSAEKICECCRNV